MSGFRIIYHTHGENNLVYCKLFKIFISLFSLCTCHGEHADVRGQLLGVASFSPPHGLQGWTWVIKLGCWVPFPPEPFHWFKVSHFEGKKEKLFKFLFELSTWTSPSNSWGYLSVTERGSMPACQRRRGNWCLLETSKKGLLLRNLGLGSQEPWRFLKLRSSQYLTDIFCCTSCVLHWVLGTQCRVPWTVSKLGFDPKGPHLVVWPYLSLLSFILQESLNCVEFCAVLFSLGSIVLDFLILHF